MITTVLWAIFWFIITFSILVLMHEGGHFLVARAFGVHVSEFMIGLPGPSLRFHGKKTDYGVTAIPLGGYVRISGMEPGPEDERLGPVLAYVTRVRQTTSDDVARDLSISLDDADALLTTLEDWNAVHRVGEGADEHTFAAHFDQSLAENPEALLSLARSTTYQGLSTFRRILVLSAGVVVNLFSAILVFVLVLTLWGIPTQTLTVDIPVAGGGAAAAGIRHAETVMAIDGHTIKDWDAMLATISSRKPRDHVIVLLREPDGSTRTVPVTLGSAPDNKNVAKLGIQVTLENVHQSIPTALTMSFGYLGLVFNAIAGFFNPHTFQTSVSESTGVIGVAVLAGQSASRGPIDYAAFIAVLSLSLGAMNILPIPPLDGGKVAIEIVEAVVRRRLSRKVSIGMSLAGTLVLIALIGYLMYADVVRFVVKGG